MFQLLFIRRPAMHRLIDVLNKVVALQTTDLRLKFRRRQKGRDQFGIAQRAGGQRLAPIVQRSAVHRPLGQCTEQRRYLLQILGRRQFARRIFLARRIEMLLSRSIFRRHHPAQLRDHIHQQIATRRALRQSLLVSGKFRSRRWPFKSLSEQMQNEVMIGKIVDWQGGNLALRQRRQIAPLIEQLAVMGNFIGLPGRSQQIKHRLRVAASAGGIGCSAGIQTFCNALIERITLRQHYRIVPRIVEEFDDNAGDSAVEMPLLQQGIDVIRIGSGIVNGEINLAENVVFALAVHPSGIGLAH
nr:hypothetical protein [Serratia marcescens]